MSRNHVRTTKRKKSDIPVSASDPDVPQTATTAPFAPKPNSSAGHNAPFTDSSEREAMIRKAAYLRAERRGFAAGHELEDWLAAQAEIDGLLTGRATAGDRDR